MGTLLCDRTLIPTAKGLIQVSDLKVGDEVFTEFGNPIAIARIETGFKNIATIQLSHGVDWDNQNRPYCLNVAVDSDLFIKEQSMKSFDNVPVEKTTKEPIVIATDYGIVNRWIMKRGQKLETPYKNPNNKDEYDNVLAMFSDSDYVIPDYYMHGSRMQKECVRDVIQKNVYFENGVYYLVNASQAVTIQVSELLEDLGHQVYATNGGIMWTAARVQDMQIIDVINLGYERRIWGIETEGKIPYQVGRCHALVSSI